MNNVVESLPSEMRPLFTEVVGAEKPDLLASLTSHDKPTPAESVAIHDILTAEFSRNLQPDGEPTDRGRKVDRLLGAFLRQWPVQGEWFRAITETGDDSGH